MEVLVSTAVALWACSVPGCGAKADVVPGAEIMTDEQKVQKVEEYCAQWVANAVSAIQKKKLPGIVAQFESVEADPKGCDIELGKLSQILEMHMMESGAFAFAPTEVGQVKAKMLYRLGKGGAPDSAECIFTFAASAGPGVPIFARSYRPDPRIFAVFLPKGK